MRDNFNEDLKPWMDPLAITSFILLIVLLLNCILCISCILDCCHSKRRVADADDDETANSPVVVTSATHTAPGGYPVTQIPATTYQPNTYGAPYPAQTTGNVTVQMPMGMPMPGAQPPMPGMPPHVPAGVYPPMMQPGAGAANMAPPSYDTAMANPGPSVMPGTYEKQMPYNPNYAQ
ncbi:calcium-binding protein P isoform X1 [Drosophila hydei]|uniref:Calcium-binding protein P isoform X1 n=1 Tax=Drosophila hydei TaxID=7224 RepID=A0A6J1MIN2_DROHY|nr:calcium-binding protein P isoform X1 [Drosophila hydei]